MVSYLNINLFALLAVNINDITLGYREYPSVVFLS
nr:MAG TPA: hypothetical protein [Caudoviricetes sp.]